MPREMPDTRVEEFLYDLTALCLEHGLWIVGCGCCGSPFVVAQGEHHTATGYVCDGDGRFLSPVERIGDDVHAPRHVGLHPHAYERPTKTGHVCVVLSPAPADPDKVH